MFLSQHKTTTAIEPSARKWGNRSQCLCSQTIPQNHRVVLGGCFQNTRDPLCHSTWKGFEGWRLCFCTAANLVEFFPDSGNVSVDTERVWWRRRGLQGHVSCGFSAPKHGPGSNTQTDRRHMFRTDSLLKKSAEKNTGCRGRKQNCSKH